MSKINCKSWDVQRRACSKNLLGSALASSFCLTCSSKEPHGLGDMIAAATKTIGIKPCKSCKDRQERLNKFIPLPFLAP